MVPLGSNLINSGRLYQDPLHKWDNNSRNRSVGVQNLIISLKREYLYASSIMNVRNHHFTVQHKHFA